MLTRIAAAIHDTDVPAADPGAAACAPEWCTTTVDGAAFAPAWQGFSSWSLPGLVFTSAPATFAAGASVPLAVQLQTDGVPQNAAADETVAFSSSSPTAQFASSPSGPWTATLDVTIAAGSSSSTVYYTDAQSGTATVTAAASGLVSGAQSETVTTAGTTVPPPAPPGPQTTAPTPPSTAGTTGPQPTPQAQPAQPRLRVASVRWKLVAHHLVVTVEVLRGSTAVRGVPIVLRVRKGSSVVAVVETRTSARGLVVWRSPRKLPTGRYVAKAAIRSASTASRTQHSAR